MAIRLSRRSLLKGSAVAGLASTVVFHGDVARAETAATGGARVARVIRHEKGSADVVLEGSGVTVSGLPVSGFPDGWQLQPGDRVLVSGPDHPIDPSTVTPLVIRLVGTVAAPTDRARVMAQKVGGVEVSLRDQTIVQTVAVDGSAVRGSRYEAYCIENANGRVLSCVAFRPARD
ncbi:hypothetical protein [Nonomuraea sp. NPDC048916]|uniref:hypothetical protein n=1 Tax=Nonomuraea sp. NPDC048916 TaxID=3154232 RepID=UPI0033D4A2C7